MNCINWVICGRRASTRKARYRVVIDREPIVVRVAHQHDDVRHSSSRVAPQGALLYCSRGCITHICPPPSSLPLLACAFDGIAAGVSNVYEDGMGLGIMRRDGPLGPSGTTSLRAARAMAILVAPMLGANSIVRYVTLSRHLQLGQTQRTRRSADES
eukprot:scaffold174985_cov37-Tisochrysis_lutea.AAC.2